MTAALDALPPEAPPTPMPAAEADALAERLNADPGDDWTYTACHPPEGGAGFSCVRWSAPDGGEGTL